MSFMVLQIGSRDRSVDRIADRLEIGQKARRRRQTFPACRFKVVCAMSDMALATYRFLAKTNS